jgi:hypothetical protein
MKVHFAIVGEGTSDSALVEHLEKLFVLCGADEVSGIAPNLNMVRGVGRSIEDKLSALCELEPNLDVVFVHRDGDSVGREGREQEIVSASGKVDCDFSVLPVVPIKELEAWLLVDEAAIRWVAGNPNGCDNLNLPSPRSVESISDPKKLLFEKILNATGLSSRRRAKFKKNLFRCRTSLVENLDPEGAVRAIPSHVALRAMLSNYVAENC